MLDGFHFMWMCSILYIANREKMRRKSERNIFQDWSDFCGCSFKLEQIYHLAAQVKMQLLLWNTCHCSPSLIPFIHYFTLPYVGDSEQKETQKDSSVRKIRNTHRGVQQAWGERGRRGGKLAQRIISTKTGSLVVLQLPSSHNFRASKINKARPNSNQAIFLCNRKINQNVLQQLQSRAMFQYDCLGCNWFQQAKSAAEARIAAANLNSK